MVALAFLSIGLICGLISRVLLLNAAFAIDWKWGVGLFLPFGPMLFRLNYPEDAQSSRWFRLATLPCVFFYLMLSPEFSSRLGMMGMSTMKPTGTESIASVALRALHLQSAPTPSVEMRQAANAKEFERLKAWSEALRLRKRDILHSDVAGARAYEHDTN
ncbi:MAG: hypothetical protein ACXWGY_02465 [Chthoniobacterales bacterium]